MVTELTEKIWSKFSITEKNIKSFVKPLAKYIHDTRPDYVLALDTGGRITSLATHIFYQQTYGGLPTLDHKIHFRKVSHHFTPEIVGQQLKPFVEYALSSKKAPYVFILDDWVTAGTTISLVRQAFAELSQNRITVRFGVMRELFTNKADISSDRFSVARCRWHSNPNLIGVDYSKSNRPYVTNSSEARFLRQKICNQLKVCCGA